MHPDFWKALDQLGSLGAARADWKLCLGSAWQDCSKFLEPTGKMADCLRHPHEPGRLLTLEEDDHGEWIAIDYEEPGDPPIQVESAAEAAELRPCWQAIGSEIGQVLGFATADWQESGPLRRIGTLQDLHGTRPAHLFLPPGCLDDLAVLMRGLIRLQNATVFLPGKRLFHPDVLSLGNTHGLTFVEVCAATVQAENAAPLAMVIAAKPSGSKTATIRPVIRLQTGMCWDQVVIEIRAGRTISIRVGNQTGEYRFPGNVGMAKHSHLGIFMSFAVDQQWSTPPSGHQHHDRDTKSFQRLRDLLRSLIPIPGKPFRRESGAYVPNFTIRLHPDLQRPDLSPSVETRSRRPNRRN